MTPRRSTDDQTPPDETTGTSGDGSAVTAADEAAQTDTIEALGQVEDATPDNVASPQENADLAHSDETAPASTRTDATDTGVPMLPGSPDEPVGPEDALGDGPKRGNYAGRVGPSGYEPTYTERIPDAKPGEPHTRLVAQRPKVEEIGDVEGEKGGVTTSSDDTPTGS